MIRQAVVSSNIKSVGYSGDILEVEFKSGKVYQYKSVPKQVHEAFIAASSKGAYFYSAIKGVYLGVPVDVESEKTS